MTIDGEQQLALELERQIPPLLRGEYHYVRVVQVNGGVAWSSPIYAAAAAPSDAPDEAPAALDEAGAR